jgi:outer membrane protein TolC
VITALRGRSAALRFIRTPAAPSKVRISLLAGAVAALLGGSGTAIAQDIPARLTLEDALRLTEQYNSQIRMNRTNRVLRESQQSRAWRDFMPRISGGYSTNATLAGQSATDLGPAYDYRSSSSAVSLNASLPFLDNGQTRTTHRNETATRAAELVSYSYQDFLQKQVVTSAFFGALQAARQVALADTQLIAARENASRTEQMVTAGKAEVPDLRSAQIQVKQQELSLFRLKTGAEQARRSLRSAMGTPDGPDFEVIGEIPAVFDPSSIDTEGLVRTATADHPSLAVAQVQSSNAARTLSQMRRDRWISPNVSFGIGRQVQGTGLGNTFNPPSESNNYSVSLFVSLPLLNRFNVSDVNSFAQMETQRDVIGEQIRSEKLRLSNDIRSAVADLKAAYTEYQASLSIATDFKAVYEMRQTQFQTGSGGINALFFEGVVNQYNQYQRNVIDALLAFTAARIRLETALGHPLSK